MKAETSHWKLWAMWILSGILLTGCANSSTNPQDEKTRNKPVVCAVNYPLAYFARRIGGEAIEVIFPAPADEDPAFWAPPADAVVTFQKADLILLNGASYAKWIARTSLPISKCVDTSTAFRNQLIPIEGTMTHTHGPAGKHRYGDWAFTTWLDFEQALLQAQAVKDALVKLSPKKQKLFDANFKSLQADLTGLDEKMKSMAQKLQTIPLVVSHPVYQYWARGYQLKTRSVHWEPDEMPSEK